MYRRILVPLDGSPLAERILPHIEELALKFASKVVFLQVLEPGEIIQRLQGDAFEARMLMEKQEEAMTYLTAWRGEFREKGVKAKSLVEVGPVVQAIINVAQREEIDLVAMVSHGRTGLPQIFYGSVAAGVLHKIDRPLLIIRAL